MTANLNALFSLQGRVALVTGGTSGVGAMLARGLLLAGARVFISGRNLETGGEAAIALSAFGQCEFICGDLAAPGGAEALAAVVADKAPDLNVLINNAGITSRGELGECADRDFDEVLALNVKVPFLLTQALHPLLKANASIQRPSHIVNTGSIAGLTTTSSSYVYGPSKAGLHHLTKVLARKMASDHILVNAIAPGLFASKMTADIVDNEQRRNATVSRSPVGRMGEPDDLARLVVAIVSNGYMTGNIIPIDGGLGL